MGVDGTGRAEAGTGGVIVQKVWGEEGDVVQATSVTADRGLQGFWIPSQLGTGAWQVGNNLALLEMIEPQNLFQRKVGNPQDRDKPFLCRVGTSESFPGSPAGRRRCLGSHTG